MERRNSSYALALRNMLSESPNFLQLDDAAEIEKLRIELQQKISTIRNLLTLPFDEAETLLSSFNFDEVAAIKFYFTKKRCCS